MSELTYPVKLQFSPQVEAFFRAEHIYLGHPLKIKGAYRIGDPVVLRAPTLVDRFATLPPKTFRSLSAFSYCLTTALPRNTMIGRYCCIAISVAEMGAMHPLDRVSTHVFSYHDYFHSVAEDAFGKAFTPVPFVDRGAQITIGNDVWIGQDALLKPGITIGDGAVVAARAVVTRDVAPYEIVGGVPARRIRMRFDDAIVAELLDLRWWRYCCVDFEGLDVTDVSAFIKGLRERIAAGTIAPWNPGFVDLGPALHAISEAQQAAAKTERLAAQQLSHRPLRRAARLARTAAAGTRRFLKKIL